MRISASCSWFDTGLRLPQPQNPSGVLPLLWVSMPTVNPLVATLLVAAMAAAQGSLPWFFPGDFRERLRMSDLVVSRINERGLIQTLHDFGEAWRARVEVMAFGRLAHQPGAVAHEFPQSYRPSEGIMRMKIRDDVADRRVKIHFSLLHETHDPDIGREL